MSEKVIFLDRDGVINCCALPHCYVTKWEEFHFLPGAAEGIRILFQGGFRIFVVTNQRGIARGLMTPEAVDALHERMCRELREQGAVVERVLMCPHEAGTCSCRKPAPGLLQMAERDIPVDKYCSWMIGDEESDIQAGKAYGVHTILIGTGQYGQDLTTPDLLTAARLILEGDI